MSIERSIAIAARVSALFKSASPLQLGATIENDKIRIHRFADHVSVTDLTNAGKRGKKVDQFNVSTPDGFSDKSPQTSDFLAKLIREDFGGAKRLAEKYLATMEEAGFRNGYLSSNSMRGVDVKPAGFHELKIHGHHVEIVCSQKDFRITAINDVNLETCIPAAKGSDVYLLYRWLSENENKAKMATFNEMTKVLDEIGINYHQYCAMD